MSTDLMSAETHPTHGEQKNRGEQSATRLSLLVARLQKHAREVHERTGKYNRASGLATLALIAGLGAQHVRGGERPALAQTDPQSRTEIYLPALFNRIAMEDLPDPTGVPATQQPATPTLEPTPTLTPEPTKNPEIVIAFDAGTVVSWDRSADPYEIKESLERIGFSGGAPVSAVANIEGQTGWITADVDGKKELAAYRFVYKGPNIVVNDEEIKSGTYFEVTFAELEKRGLVDQLPDADFEYTGPRDEIVKVLARDMEVIPENTNIPKWLRGYSVFEDIYPANGFTEIPPGSNVVLSANIRSNGPSLFNIALNYWREGSASSGISIVSDSGRLTLYAGHGDNSYSTEIEIANINPRELDASINLQPDRRTVYITVRDSSGEDIVKTVVLPFDIESNDFMSRALVATNAPDSPVMLNSFQVSFDADQARLIDDRNEDLKRKSRLNTHEGSLLQSHSNVYAPALSLGNLARFNQSVPDWLRSMRGDINGVMVHDGVINGEDTGAMQQDRGLEYYFNIRPYLDKSLLRLLEQDEMDGIWVADTRILSGRSGGLASPVSPDATKEDMVDMLTRLNIGRKPSSRLRLAFNGFFGTDGKLGNAISRIANISALPGEISQTFPDGIAVFDDIPFMPRDTVFDATTRRNIRQSIGALNASETFNINTILVSAAPSSGVDGKTHLQQLENLVDEMREIGVDVGFVDVGGSDVSFEDIKPLASGSRSASGRETPMILFDTRRKGRFLPGAGPLYDTDSDNKLRKTDAYDRVINN